MKTAIVGAGNIGLGYAAFLLLNGHDVSVWSPSGTRTKDLRNGEALVVTGAIEGSFNPNICTSAEEAAEADTIVLALPAYGHREVLDALVPFVEERHTIIISAHLSFAALYIAKRLASRGIEIPIVAWSTTVLTSKTRGPNRINVGALRSTVDIATIPVRYSPRGLNVCLSLFGNRFAVKKNILSIALSNVNPEIHLAEALLNLTRIERKEDWLQNTMVTSTVGKLIEALDEERITLANALGESVRTVYEHFKFSYAVVGTSVAELAEKQVENGSNPAGPIGLDSRWILEDVPYGIVPTLYLAELAGVEVPLHRSALNIISASYARDFAADNDLLPEIGSLEVNTLKALMDGGYGVACVKLEQTGDA